ncbi:DUF3048 domain-containing protein [Candidatus Saccharibacteria bacterium]|nr:DUF3048 domain-containing protein [Candidatus Saccharibacteria bacterium]
MEVKKKPLAKIANFLKSHKLLTAVIAVLLVAALTVGAMALIKNLDKPTIKGEKAGQPEKPKIYYAELTGKQVNSKAEVNAPVTGVMIENSPDARPQSGLKNSGVVFEAIAEGGITRFLVLYQTEKPQLIGPVRSVRIYYLNWAGAFDASIAHVGGSDDALALVRSDAFIDLDQFFNSNYYWRSTDRYAPHNVYTSFDKLDALNASKGHTTSNFTGWPRQDGKPAKTPTATSIDVHISGYLYDSHYDYDATSNTYLRSQAGEAHMDREAGQIAPNVVIAIKVDETTRSDNLHQDVNAIGSGDAYIFQNGIVTEGTWTKATRNDQIKFTDKDGKTIKLNRGQTWVTAVPNGSGSVKWQ